MNKVSKSEIQVLFQNGKKERAVNRTSKSDTAQNLRNQQPTYPSSLTQTKPLTQPIFPSLSLNFVDHHSKSHMPRH